MNIEEAVEEIKNLQPRMLIQYIDPCFMYDAFIDVPCKDGFVKHYISGMIIIENKYSKDENYLEDKRNQLVVTFRGVAERFKNRSKQYAN